LFCFCRNKKTNTRIDKKKTTHNNEMKFQTED